MPTVERAQGECTGTKDHQDRGLRCASAERQGENARNGKTDPLSVLCLCLLPLP